MNELINLRARIIMFALIILSTGLHSSRVYAEAGCPDSGLWSGKLLTDICWGCMFPIRVSGAQLTKGDVPDGASKKALCNCSDNHGMTRFGVVTSMYEPSRIVEIVRKPNCSMALGGASLPISNSTTQGGASKLGTTNEDPGFYNYHYYSFPLLSILELYMPKQCSVDGYSDFDIMYVSEIDPTWNNSEMAFFTNPEAALAATPVAISACAGEAAVLTAGKPISSMWWCAGSWGGMYPMSGFAGSLDFARATSLLATRAVGALHRRGLAHKTMGDENLCSGSIYPTIPKDQYKFSMFYPVSEPNKGHLIGKHPWQWDNGPGSRVIPGVGEDALYLLYRWRDCCSTY